MQSWPLPKDPQDSCKLRFDWSNRLADGDTITTSTVVVDDTDLVISQAAIDGAYATFRVTGGVHGAVYTITNHVVLSNGNEWDQSGKLRVRSN